MKNKRGQVTMFIILGIIIVVTALLIFLFRPKITATTSFNTENPSAFIHSCLEEKIDSTLNQIYLNGGVLGADHIYNYEGEDVTYLCYTNQYHKPCVNQQPLLETHIKNQLHSEINPALIICFDSLKENYEKKGYVTELKKGTLGIEILPKSVLFNLTNYEIIITKQDTRTYNSFDISTESDLYTILSMVKNMIKEEILLGDAKAIPYMNSFRNFKIEKDHLSDGTTIYILINKDTKNKFQFASRSQALSSDQTIRR